jgi:hypothetical protein
MSNPDLFSLSPKLPIIRSIPCPRIVSPVELLQRQWSHDSSEFRAWLHAQWWNWEYYRNRIGCTPNSQILLVLELSRMHQRRLPHDSAESFELGYMPNDVRPSAESSERATDIGHDVAAVLTSPYVGNQRWQPR